VDDDLVVATPTPEKRAPSVVSIHRAFEPGGKRPLSRQSHWTIQQEPGILGAEVEDSASFPMGGVYCLHPQKSTIHPAFFVNCFARALPGRSSVPLVRHCSQRHDKEQRGE